jgi:hypothetical protein
VKISKKPEIGNGFCCENTDRLPGRLCRLAIKTLALERRVIPLSGKTKKKLRASLGFFQSFIVHHGYWKDTSWTLAG